MQLIGIYGPERSGRDTITQMLEKRGFVVVSLADPLKRHAMEIYDFDREQLWGDSELLDVPDERFPRGWKLTCGCICSTFHWVDDPMKRAFAVDKILHACPNHPEDRWSGYILRPENPEWCEPQIQYLTPRLCLRTLQEQGQFCYPETWVFYALRVTCEIMTEGRGYSPWGGISNLGWLGDFHPRGICIPDLTSMREVESIRKAGGQTWRVHRPGTKDTGILPNSAFGTIIRNNGTIEDLAHAINERFMLD